MHVAIDHELARGVSAVCDLLPDTGNAPACRKIEATCVGIDFVLNQGKQGRFTCTVFTHKANALAGVHNKIGLVY
jgi:hypothetical protein